jgi:hypothetical protein
MYFHSIKKIDLHKYVINNYFDNNYYENIDSGEITIFLQTFFGNFPIFPNSLEKFGKIG